MPSGPCLHSVTEMVWPWLWGSGLKIRAEHTACALPSPPFMAGDRASGLDGLQLKNDKYVSYCSCGLHSPSCIRGITLGFESTPKFKVR